MCFGTRKVANYAKRPLILTLAGGTVSFASAIAQEPDDQPIIRDEPGKVNLNPRCRKRVPREATGDKLEIEKFSSQLGRLARHLSRHRDCAGALDRRRDVKFVGSN